MFSHSNDESQIYVSNFCSNEYRLYSCVSECENSLLAPYVFKKTQAAHYAEHFETAEEREKFDRESQNWAKIFDAAAPRIISQLESLKLPKIVEDFAFMLISIKDAKRPRTVVIAICVFLKSYLDIKGSVMLFLLKKVSKLLHSTTQSEEVFETSMIESFINNFKKYKNSENSKKFYKLIMYVFSLSAFGYDEDNVNFESTYKHLFKKVYHEASDFITVFLDGIVFMCKTGYQCYKTGTLSPIWHHDDAYNQYVADVMEVKRNLILLNDPETHGINIFAFQAKVEALIEQGDAMIQFSNSECASERKFLAKLVNDVKMIKSELTTKKAAQESRAAPFSLLIYGHSSIGKSSFTQLLFQHYGKIFGLPIDSEFLYTRNSVDQFWSGFTSVQWGVVLDDIGFMKPTAAPNGDPSLLEMLQVVNNVPYNPNQAELEAKGRTPLRCKLVLATSNVEDLNAFSYFACPLAVRRRLPYVIELRPKPEYTSNQIMLDTTLLPERIEDYPDFWGIEVKKVVPATPDRATLESIGYYTDIHEFLAWYGREAKAFEVSQKKAMSSMNACKVVPVCSTCCFVSSRCKCALPQVGFSKEGIISHFVSHPIYLDTLHYLYSFAFFRCIILCVLRHLWTRSGNFLAMRLVGRRRFQSFEPPVHLRVFLACISTASFYFLFRQFFPSEEEERISDVQGGAISRPRRVEGERENVWYNENIELTHFDIGRATLSLKGSEAKAEDMITNNIVFLNTRHKSDVDSVRFQSAVCVRDCTYMANNHLFPEEGEYKVTVWHNGMREGIDTKIQCIVDSRMFDRRPEKDLVFFQLKAVPPKRDITKMFARVPIKGKFAGTLVSKPKGVVAKRHVKAIHTALVNVESLDKRFEQYVGSVDLPTSEGDCGSPLIISSAYGPVLAGIHIVGNENMVGSIIVLQCDIDRINFRWGVQAGTSLEDLSLNAPSAKHVLGPLHPKSVFRYIQNGNAALLGSFQGSFRSKGNSMVRKTPYYEDMLQLGYRDISGAPDMNTWRPWRLAALEMTQISNPFNDYMLSEVKECFLEEIISDLKELPDSCVNIEDIHPYDDDTVLNGEPGVAFVDKINRSTSAGFPWKTTKKKFLVEQECSIHSSCVYMSEEIADRVARMEETYLAGERVYPVFAGNLKDEALPIEKCLCGKTRVFAGGPFDWTFIVRKYYLSIVRLIQNHQQLFECSVGISAQSLAWDDLYQYLVQFGEDRMFAGDYSKYDKKMSPTVILEAFEILISLAITSGNYSHDDIKVMRGIAVDTAFPIIDFNGDLVQFFGSNPSGHPLTVVINSLVNSLYMRYAYTLLNPLSECYTFKRNVALITYGDDNVAGVNKDCYFFDHTTVQECFASLGIKYTMADKESESVPFLNISNIEFLKRTWRYDKELGHYVCPLNENSIHKMLTRVVISKTVAREVQAAQVLDTACREYFWYGRDIFEQKRSEFLTIYQKYEYQPYGWDGIFPTWDILKAEFLETSTWSLATDQDLLEEDHSEMAQ
jgi:hypothetical protein